MASAAVVGAMAESAGGAGLPARCAAATTISASVAGRSDGDLALRHARVVVVIRGDAPAKRLSKMRMFMPAARDANAIVYVRRP